MHLPSASVVDVAFSLVHVACGVSPAVLSDLLEVGEGVRRNSVYTRVLWCLSTQQLSPTAWKESTPAVLSRVTVLLASPDSISTSVDTEALNVIKR